MSELTTRLNRMRSAIYLATEASVADDIADALKQAVETLETLEQERNAARALSPANAATLCAFLKEECEQQHARAERAEAEVKKLRAILAESQAMCATQLEELRTGHRAEIEKLRTGFRLTNPAREGSYGTYYWICCDTKWAIRNGNPCPTCGRKI